jgi:hypothetical protein
LLGAGTSAEAGIPTSVDMIGKIEAMLIKQERWSEFCKLYNQIKSSIYYSAGLRGHFNNQFNYNIEVLVNTLYELERNEEHPLYPFIAAWNSRFVALAHADFSGVKDFRRLILVALKKWMCPEDTSFGDYYRGLVTLQRDLNFPLPVFSLNYDLCVERLVDRDFRVETGFPGFGAKNNWDWQRFEVSDQDPGPQILLYKIHGSINWKRDDSTKQLFSVEQVENIDPDRMEIIFGRDFKLDAADPYLFYAYEFRRYILIAKLIVVIGYGFGDTHINKMLTQGIKDDRNRVLYVVNKCNGGSLDEKILDIVHRLDLGEGEKQQVRVIDRAAKQFLETPDLAKILLETIPKNPDSPF